MRILKLSANERSFRTVNFKPVGLSLVVAEQKSGKSSPTRTYNGVGKSLMLELIHYCLGSNKKTAFEKHLKGWIFSLTIDIDGAIHTISRSADKPSEIQLDHSDITLTKLKEFLEGECFDAKPNIPNISFRSIVPRFIRSGRSAYVKFSYASEGEAKNQYGAMLGSAFLLGLDLHLARTKYDLRKRHQKLNDTMKQLEQEPLFAELLAEDTVDIELTALKEQADKLQSDLNAFRVAEDYHEIEEEANRIKRGLDRLRREAVKLGEAIAQIDRSLKSKSDLPAERVFGLYEEAAAQLPDSVKRRIEDVVEFQKELQQKRIYRLTRERQQLERELKKQRADIKSASAQLDQKLGYLSEHRALDEYAAVSNELSEIKQRLAKLEESKVLREKIDRELKTIERDLAEENIRTDDYLSKASPLIDEATIRFRSFTKELYGARPSGLSVGSDSGENQQRYRIDAHISADAAEGINEAKIFCFDMTVLTLRRGHRFQFLVHDSTLFGPIDPRQRLQMFCIANRVCQELGVQYIATLNLHDITSAREQVDVEEDVFEQLFGEKSVVLRLTDKSNKDKLLGIGVDMDYTK